MTIEAKPLLLESKHVKVDDVEFLCVYSEASSENKKEEKVHVFVSSEVEELRSFPLFGNPKKSDPNGFKSVVPLIEMDERYLEMTKTTSPEFWQNVKKASEAFRELSEKVFSESFPELFASGKFQPERWRMFPCWIAQQGVSGLNLPRR